MNDIAPGWYKDPAEPSTQRYWDGGGWIGDSLPIDAIPPDSPPEVAPPHPVTLPPGPGTPPATPAGAPPAGAPPEAGAGPGGPRIGSLPPAPPAWPAVAPPGSVPPASAPPAAMPPGSVPPGSAPPAAMPPGSVPPGSAPPAGWAPGAPPAAPGAPGAWPPGAWPPGAWPPGAWPPGGPPALPPGAPPGSIPWPPGAPLPPGYRLAYAPVRPRPHGLPVAPLGLRFLARLIDFGIVLGLSAVATGWLVYLFISDYAPFVNAMAHGQEDLPAIPSRASALAWVIPLIAMVVWLAYEVPAIARGGQTVGKRAVGIKVMALESEEPIGGPRALRRWVPLGLPMLLWTCGLGFILQLMDSISATMGGPMHMAMHDRSAQTVVVQVGRRGHEIAPVKVAKKTGEQP